MRAGATLLFAIATLVGVALPQRCASSPPSSRSGWWPELGGDRVRLGLVPPGASTHTFEPQPSDVQSLVHARLVLEVGGGSTAGRQRCSRPRPRAEQLTLLELPGLDPLARRRRAARCAGGAAQRLDPHAWLGRSACATRWCQRFAAKLTALDPPGRAHYGYARLLVQRLGASTPRSAARSRTRASLLAFHGAWRCAWRHRPRPRWA
jgi:ABC-type Zn uptake system ZnuABC Zn-binding protein ZnuA